MHELAADRSPFLGPSDFRATAPPSDTTTQRSRFRSSFSSPSSVLALPSARCYGHGFEADGCVELYGCDVDRAGDRMDKGAAASFDGSEEMLVQPRPQPCSSVVWVDADEVSVCLKYREVSAIKKRAMRSDARILAGKFRTVSVVRW